MAALKKVTLVGAGGNVGQEILIALVAAGFQVNVLTRAGSSSTFDAFPSVNVVRGEYTPVFFRRALKGQDALILAVGPASIQSQKDLISAAAEVGVKRIIPSEFGSDITNPATNKALPFHKEKIEIAEYLDKLAQSNPHTKWTGITCGPFFSWCLANGWFGFDIPKRQVTLYDEGVVKFDATNLDTVGKAVANVLSLPEKYQNDRVFISGLAVSQKDILNAVQKVMGTDGWTIKRQTAESLRDRGHAKISKGDYNGMVDIFEAAIFQDGSGSLYSSIRTLANKDLGVNDDLEASVRKALKDMTDDRRPY